jgi:RNA polymerase sigma factor (sigma-70 family)
MKELNELIKQYKKTKDHQLLNQIFEVLKNIIKKKAEFLFYQKTFKFGKYEFKLVDTKQVELNDVKQELNLELLRMIKDWKGKQPFENYLFASLWNWRPKFVNKSLIQETFNIHEIDEDEDSKIDNIPAEPEEIKEDINIDEMFSDLTEIEKKIIILLKDNPELNQSELADIIGVTQQRISELMTNIRKKYNKGL